MSWDSKVLWTEGLFVQPHHFQQADRYAEALVGGLARRLRPYAWGVSTLDIDFDDGDAVQKVARTAVRAYEKMSIQPAQGMGVLFFPAYLPSSPLAMKFHKQLDRHTVHEGGTADDEKWVHQTWVWPSHPQFYYDGVETDGVEL